MKKFLILGAVVGILGLTVTGFAFAQNTSPPQPENSGEYYGSGRMGMWGGRSSSMWEGGWRPGRQSSNDAYGLMHDEMITELAEIINLSVGELEERLEAGDTMWRLAEGQGLTFEQFRELMLQARNQAISQAAANGGLSQEQANWMIQRMDQMWRDEYNPDFQGCFGAGSVGFSHRGGWMHWDNTR